MTTSSIYRAATLFLVFFGLGMGTATADTVDLLGQWDGSVSIATDLGFGSSNVSVKILQQQGVTFSGTAQFGDDDPFNINGVVDKKSIHITGSTSIFDANISGQGMHRAIHGTGSRLETDLYPAATVVFDLGNKEYNCTHSGGTVETASCCVSAGNFPDLCGIGTCGCPPDGSHQISTCNCGNNKCFNGNKCVSR